MFKKMMLVVVCVAMLVPAQAARADTGPVQRLGTGIPTSIAASPDGTTLAVGSSIGVWFLDVVTLTPNGFWDTGVWVDSVAYSVDGRYVLADKMVYEVASSRVVEVSEVNWLDHRCSFDKRLCIEQNIQDGYVYSTKVVDTNTLVVAKILEVGVQDMAWSPNGELLYTVGYEYDYRKRRNSDYLVKAWNTTIWRQTQKAEKLFTDSMHDVHWSSDGTQIALDRFVWDVNIARIERLWSCQWWQGRGGFDCDWSRMDYGWSSVRLYDLDAHRLLHEFTPHHIVLWSASLSADEQHLVTSGQDNLRDCPNETWFWSLWRMCKTRDVSTRIWDVGDLKLIAELPVELYDPQFSDDGKFVIGHTYSSLDVWDWQNTQKLWSAKETIICQPWPFWGVRCANGSNGLAVNSEFVASYTYPDTRNAVHLYRLATGELVATLTDRTAPITAVAFSPDGTKVAASSSDGTILIWPVP